MANDALVLYVGENRRFNFDFSHEPELNGTTDTISHFSVSITPSIGVSIILQTHADQIGKAQLTSVTPGLYEVLGEAITVAGFTIGCSGQLRVVTS